MTKISEFAERAYQLATRRDEPPDGNQHCAQTAVIDITPAEFNSQSDLELWDFLDSLTEREVRMLLTLCYWGRDLLHHARFDARQLSSRYRYVCNTFPTKQITISQLTGKVRHRDFIGTALNEFTGAGLDIDQLMLPEN